MTSAPSIETTRLRLRAHAVSDLAACVAMWSDPIVVQHIGARPSSAQQTWARVLGYAGLWALLGFGYWVIEEKVTGAYVGELGFADFKRDVALSMRDVPELGWALNSAAHGKGFATEAASAAVAWGDANLRAERTVCLIDAENTASIRVARKCGYEPFESTRLGDRPTIFLSRIAKPAPAAP